MQGGWLCLSHPWCALQVYFDEGEKPEIGQGLNKSAEVTLLGVYKMDKATGQPTTDPAAIDKFIKRLKQTAASQHARFLEYNPEGGVWRFLVEHFSKYAQMQQSPFNSLLTLAIIATALFWPAWPLYA